MSETEVTAPVDRDKALKRVALLVGLAFLAPVLVLTFTPPSAGGVSCGTWVTPAFGDELDISFAELDVAAAGGDPARVTAIAAECGDKLAARRALVFSLLAFGLVVRFSLVPIIRGLRA